MANTQICNDTSEKIELFQAQGLYLKPIAKLNVCVQLPQLKQPGKSISNWEVMERVKHMARPHAFLTLKIIKSTLEFIRLEGETETKALVKTLIQRLDGKTIKLSGFPDILKVKAAEAKVSFPLRHDWDVYFRDAKNMDEMKSGERPDTIHFRDLPTRWFASTRSRESDKPSEQVLKRIWEGFGEVRCVDIPMLDPYRKEMTTSSKSGAIQTFTFGQDLTFESFVQYKEYIGFVKAMDSLRGMKLLFMADDEKAYTANIKVDFDKTKHLSDKAIKKRRIERQKLEQLEKEREDKVRKEREEEERKQEEERQKKKEEEEDKERKRLEKIQKKEDRRKSREEKRKLKTLHRRKKEEERKLQQKIALEERKFLLAQRKLESLRLMSEIFNRVKKIKVKEDLEKHEKEAEDMRMKEIVLEQKWKEQEIKRRIEVRKRKKDRLEKQEHELRNKILKNWKDKEQKAEETQRELLRKKVAKRGKLKSAVVVKR